MKLEYKMPQIEVVKFDSEDIICASGDIAPVAQTLTLEGTYSGNTHFVDLTK